MARQIPSGCLLMLTGFFCQCVKSPTSRTVEAPGALNANVCFTVAVFAVVTFLAIPDFLSLVVKCTQSRRSRIGYPFLAIVCSFFESPALARPTYGRELPNDGEPTRTFALMLGANQNDWRRNNRNLGRRRRTGWHDDRTPTGPEWNSNKGY